VTKGAHGYAGYFVNSVLDNSFQKDMSLDDGVAALKKCIHELRTRFIIKQPNFVAKIVTKEGIKVINLD
jgi:20S proteasome subunit beta 4